MLKKQLFILLSICLPAISFAQKINSKNKYLNIQSFYDSSNLKGCMVIYDTKNNTYYLHDTSLLYKSYTPASTFKIPNTLMALETGVAKDENFIIQWDSIARWSPNWNQDHTLKMAFKNSTVWYYQELARRMGSTQMKVLLNQFQYGNMDTSGGVDLYWLTGGMRISPFQQIDFLQKLHKHQLPISERSMSICEHIMVLDSNSKYCLRAKTGWSADTANELGWFVGYYQTKDNVYYFAHCVFPQGPRQDNMFQIRKEIVYRTFRSLKFIP